MAPIVLPPFELLDPLGRGAMGTVWRGRHAEDPASAVAIKVLAGEVAADPAFRDAFAEEVGAAARLDHPGVVCIFDHGTVPMDIRAPVAAEIEPGAPYLVMELVEGGPLSDWRGRLRWAELRTVLLSLLDALAHAHARGVIHRDLKPDNVLFRADRAGVKLTDFGVAHRTSADAAARSGDGERLLLESRGLVGTPDYMAPEQVKGRRHELGPWTDLYGLGCLAFTLASGRRPFHRGEIVQTLYAQLKDDVPPLDPHAPVPPGFERWLRRLLEKDPAARFRRAADAAWALMRLENDTTTASRAFWPVARDSVEGPEGSGEVQWTRWTDEATARGDGLSVEALSFVHERTSEALPALEPASAHPAQRPDHPPLPATWRRPRRAGVRVIQGAGLALFDLRDPHLAGREAERDLLWTRLGEVCAGGLTRVVAITGPAGIGKSRLADWLCERAHELGAATPLVARHAPEPAPGDGLGPMLARYLQLGLVPPDRRAPQIAAVAEALGLDVRGLWLLEGMLARGEDRTTGTGRRVNTAGFALPGADARATVIKQVVNALSRDRPVILHLDDAPHGRAALRLVQQLLTQRPHPVLVLLTGDDGVPPGDTESRALWSAVLAHPATDAVRLGPLSEDAQHQLVADMVQLSPKLVSQVIRRADGNPMFCVQLLRGWIQRNALVQTPDGFALTAATADALPEDVSAMWADRLDRALDAEARPVAELAAALGARVDEQEWAAACQVAGVASYAAARDLLMAQRLIAPLEGRTWAFVHPGARAALLEAAAARDDVTRLHQACADALLLAAVPGSDARRARHLLAARAWLDAEPVLLSAADAHRLRGEPTRAREHLLERHRALRAAGVPRRDPRVGAGRLRWAALARESGDIDRALRLARRAREDARSTGSDAALARALLELSACDRLRGNARRAMTRCRAAWDHALVAHDRDTATRAAIRLARGLTEAGRAQDAVRALAGLLALAPGELDDRGRASAELEMARARMARGDPGAARQHLARVVPLADACGDPRLGFWAAALRGDLERDADRLEDAALAYEDAARHMTDTGPLRPELAGRRAWLAALRGRATTADVQLVAAADAAQGLGDRGHAAVLEALRLLPLAGLGDWAEWDATLDTALEVLGRLERHDARLGVLAERTAHLALAAGHAGRATRVARLALYA
jgi:serine/threonine protein kinase/tetratricopeptide (TPR) repeat protein